jgi:membrane protease YdiL (CAAX protease family)
MENILKLFTLHSAIILILITGLLLFAKTEKKKLTIHFIILLVITKAMYFVPTLGIFDKLTFMWQPKILISLICIAYIIFLSTKNRNDISFSLKFKKEIWIYFICFLVVMVGVNSILSGELGFNFELESILFSLTLPGISEELFFRGIMMSIFNNVFTARRQILGISVGWAALIQILFFGIGHAFYFDADQHIQFYMVGFLFTTVMGILLTFIKEKSGSILPSIFLHNAYNTIISIL